MDLQSANGSWETKLVFDNFEQINSFLDDVRAIKLNSYPNLEFTVSSCTVDTYTINANMQTMIQFEDWHDIVDKLVDKYDVPHATWIVNYTESVVKESYLLRDKFGNDLNTNNIVIYNDNEYFIHDVSVMDNDKACLLMYRLDTKSYDDKINGKVCVNPKEVVYTKKNIWDSKDYLNNYILDKLKK